MVLTCSRWVFFFKKTPPLSDMTYSHADSFANIPLACYCKGFMDGMRLYPSLSRRLSTDDFPQAVLEDL